MGEEEKGYVVQKKGPSATNIQLPNALSLRLSVWSVIQFTAPLFHLQILSLPISFSLPPSFHVMISSLVVSTKHIRFNYPETTLIRHTGAIVVVVVVEVSS